MKAFKTTLAAAAMLFVGVSAYAYEFHENFSYFANGHEIKSVLTDFARTQGLTAEFTPNVRGKVNGRFRGVPAKDFLRAMEEAYGVGYYVLGGNIHFYRLRDSKKELITVRNGRGEDLVASLSHSGFIAEELPVRVNASGSVLTVRGPQGYIDQVRSALDTYQSVLSEKIVMRVFPVKYAWADDITVSSMDSTITVPGIATILRGMVMGQSVGGQTVSQQRSVARAQAVEGVGAQGLSKQRHEDAPRTTSNTTPVSTGSISIMADPRVNAVLVSDAAYRMPYYESVIRDLDKPVELVEIHAAIVDIDTSADRDLGINFSGKGSDNNGWSAGGSIGAANTDSSNAIQTTTSTGGALLSTIYTHGSDYFLARVSAMESNNEARMLGRPSVLTVDNVQATLENTTTYYIPLQGTEAVDLYKVEAGTVLRVTPHIIRENGQTSIKLAVNVQDDQNDSSAGYQSLTSTGSVTVSPIKQTKINTQAIVNVGQSLLIGGYYYEQKSDGDSGVPVLKDIPLLGYLFKSSSKKGRLMERLILITPRLVTPEAANVPERVNSTDFHRTATQSDYLERKVEAKGK